MNGITVGGYGCGALIFTHVQTAYLNPNNISPDEKNGTEDYFTQDEILSRVPSLFVMLGIVYLIIELIGCAMIFTPPQYPDEVCILTGCLHIFMSKILLY